MPQCVIVPLFPLFHGVMEERLTQLIPGVEMPWCIRPGQTREHTSDTEQTEGCESPFDQKKGVHLQGKSFVVPTYYLLFKSAKSGRQNIV